MKSDGDLDASRMSIYDDDVIDDDVTSFLQEIGGEEPGLVCYFPGQAFLAHLLRGSTWTITLQLRKQKNSLFYITVATAT